MHVYKSAITQLNIQWENLDSSQICKSSETFLLLNLYHLRYSGTLMSYPRCTHELIIDHQPLLFMN